MRGDVCRALLVLHFLVAPAHLTTGVLSLRPVAAMSNSLQQPTVHVCRARKQEKSWQRDAHTNSMCGPHTPTCFPRLCSLRCEAHDIMKEAVWAPRVFVFLCG